MARESRPQPGRFDTYPNAGPYSADELGELFRDFIVGEDFPDQGVFYGTSNQLEVTNPAGSTFQIDTGRAHVYGRYLRNDAAVSITPSTPTVASRTDRVVAILNNTNGTIFTQSPTGYFFNVEGVSVATGIPAYSIELAIMKGTEGGGVPALEQNGSRLWMIPLAQYQISTGGVISNFVDQREWVDAEDKRFLAQYTQGEQNTATPTHADALSDIRGISMSGLTPFPGDITTVYCGFAVPHDFISGLQVTPIIVSAVGAPPANNADLSFRVYYATCGETYNTHSSVVNNQAVAIPGPPAGQYVCLTSLTQSLSSAALNDFVRISFERDGDAGADNYAGEIYANGVLVQYFGWKR